MSVSIASSVTVRVRLFASYAERLRRDTVELSLPTGSTVGDVLRMLRGLPGGDAVPERPLCAVNLTHVGLDAPVNDSDELAVLPPLAGG